MAEYVPTPVKWVREQIELYEASGGTEGTELGGRPVIIVTHRGNRTGAIRKTALMRVKDADRYVLVGSMGGAPRNPVWSTPARLPMSRSATRPRFTRMGCGKWKKPTNATGSGRWPWKPSPPTRNTRTRRRGRSRCSSPSRSDHREGSNAFKRAAQSRRQLRHRPPALANPRHEPCRPRRPVGAPPRLRRDLRYAGHHPSFRPVNTVNLAQPEALIPWVHSVSRVGRGL